MGVISLDTIVLDVSESKRLVQRSSGVGSITITGTQTGGTTIEARVVDYSTEVVEATAWATLDASPGATFTGTISNVPEGGWYSIQVRLSNETGTTDTSKANTEKFGIGDWVAILGQSNAAYLFDHPVPNSALSPNDLACKVVVGTDTVEDLDGLTDDGITEYADRFITSTSVPIGFICYAVGATYLDALAWSPQLLSGAWLPTTQTLYTAFSDAVTYVGACPYVVWMQGESEASLYRPDTATLEATANAELITDPPQSYDKHYENLQTLVAALKVTCGSDVVGFICTTPRQKPERSVTGYPLIDTHAAINDAQIAIISDEPNFYRIDTKHYSMADNLHLNTASLADLGDKIGYVHLHSIDSTTYPYAPPTVTSFNPVSATSTTVKLSSSTLVLSSGTECEGWKLYDKDGLEVTVSGATLSGNTVTLTHTSCDKVRYPRYLWGTNPTGNGAFVSDPDVIVLQETGSLPWPLWFDSVVDHDLITKIAGTWVNTKEEHSHWNKQVLDETQESFTSALLADVGLHNSVIGSDSSISATSATFFKTVDSSSTLISALMTIERPSAGSGDYQSMSFVTFKTDNYSHSTNILFGAQGVAWLTDTGGGSGAHTVDNLRGMQAYCNVSNADVTVANAESFYSRGCRSIGGSGGVITDFSHIRFDDSVHTGVVNQYGIRSPQLTIGSGVNEFINYHSGAFKVDTNGLCTGAGFALSSGVFTGNLTGNASGSSGSCTGNSATATVATNATQTGDATTNANLRLAFWGGFASTEDLRSNTGLHFNPSTDIMTAPKFVASTSINTVTTVNFAKVFDGSIADSLHRHESNVLEKNADYTLTASDSGKTIFVWNNNAATTTITLPTGVVGMKFTIVGTMQNVLGILKVASGGEFIIDAGTSSLTGMTADIGATGSWASVTLECVTDNLWNIGPGTYTSWSVTSSNGAWTLL